jgi:hypothetical protein
MSRSVDLFIDANLPLDELAGALGGHVGTPLAAEPDGRGWRLVDGGVEALLAEHAYRDDGELLLSRYRYALSARLPNEVRPHDTSEAAMLRRVSQQIQRGPAWPVLLVHDLQYRDRPAAAPDPGLPGGPAEGPAGEPAGGPDAAGPAAVESDRSGTGARG